MPKARSFQNLALTAPSVSTGQLEGGLQINGASGAENSFTVDGVVTNSLVNGRSRQDTVFEYLQEVQVKTAGIDAEYGGALGGVVSAVTKSGGNAFHGEGHYYFEGSPISAGPVKRLVLNPADDTTVAFVQDPKQHLVRNEVRRLARRPDREGSRVLLRIRVPAFYALRSGLPVLQWQGNGEHSDRDSQLHADVRQDFGVERPPDRQTSASSTTPNRTTGTFTAYNGFGPLWSFELAGCQPVADRARLQGGSEHHQRRTWTTG